MDENDFMRAFMGVDVLAVEGVSRTAGLIVAKLREGMVDGGMSQQDAHALICEALRVFISQGYVLHLNQVARDTP